MQCSINKTTGVFVLFVQFKDFFQSQDFEVFFLKFSLPVFPNFLNVSYMLVPYKEAGIYLHHNRPTRLYV